MPHQLPFDFTPKPQPADFGKKVDRIPVSCSAEFKKIFRLFVEMTQSESDSELGFRYIVEGMQRDIGEYFLNRPEMMEKIREFISKG